MPQIQVTLSRDIVAPASADHLCADDVIVRCTITAPHETTQQRPRLPLNVGLVIDRSGSMAGQKLSDAITACRRIVQRLNEDDRCTVVTFDHTATMLADGERISRPRRALIMQALDEIRTGGTTNLSAGWQLAADQVLRRQSQAGTIGHIMLLTDGMANQGITDITHLEAIARDYQHRGVSVSTYGLGAGYAENELRRIAEAGQGTHQFIEHSIDIERYFSNELSELFTVTYRDVSMRVTIPAGFDAEVIGQLPHTHIGNEIVISIGAMVSLEQRSIYIRLTPQHVTVPSSVALIAELQGQRNDNTSAHARCTTSLQIASTHVAAQAIINREVEYEAVLVDIAHVRSEAQQFNRSGDRNHAHAYVLRMQARSDIFARYDIYAQLAQEMREVIDNLYAKRSESINTLGKRASLKDLILMKERLAELVARGIDNSQVTMLRDQIEILERILNRRNGQN